VVKLINYIWGGGMAIKQNKDGSYEIVPDPDTDAELGVLILGFNLAVGALALGVHNFGDDSLKNFFFESSKKSVPSSIEYQCPKSPVQDTSVVFTGPK
jgi:hypothetical protein